MDKILDSSKTRYFPPSRVDKAPYGTVLYVDSEKDGLIIYVQLNEDQENPDWVKGRNLLEKVFKDLECDTTFIEICVKILQTKDKSLYITLCDIIKNKYKETV